LSILFGKDWAKSFYSYENQTGFYSIQFKRKTYGIWPKYPDNFTISSNQIYLQNCFLIFNLQPFGYRIRKILMVGFIIS